MKRDPELVTDEELALINARVPGARPMQAYYLGCLHSLAIRDRIRMNAELLDKAADFSDDMDVGMRQLDEFYKVWARRFGPGDRSRSREPYRAG